MKMMSRLLSLLMTLMLLFTVTGMAAEKLTPIQELGIELVDAQADYDAAAKTLEEADQKVASLEKKFEKNPNSTKIQDQLIDAMVLQEEAQEECDAAGERLQALQARQQTMAEEAECEPLTVEYDGKYADLVITVLVDENMVIYDLDVQVKGGERDQLVGQDSYLYQFVGKDIPLTIGKQKKDDVAPHKEAEQTSKDLVAGLNSLVYVEEEEEASGPIIEPQAIADYIFKHGRLPDNFITKKEAQKLGWDSSRNYVSDVAPGKSIGGDRFGNYEGRLPSKKGRTWYEADCYYTKGKRNAHRILYSNDGLVYYTDDHYETFTQMFPSK